MALTSCSVGHHCRRKKARLDFRPEFKDGLDSGGVTESAPKESAKKTGGYVVIPDWLRDSIANPGGLTTHLGTRFSSSRNRTARTLGRNNPDNAYLSKFPGCGFCHHFRIERFPSCGSRSRSSRVRFAALNRKSEAFCPGSAPHRTRSRRQKRAISRAINNSWTASPTPASVSCFWATPSWTTGRGSASGAGSNSPPMTRRPRRQRRTHGTGPLAHSQRRTRRHPSEGSRAHDSGRQHRRVRE